MSHVVDIVLILKTLSVVSLLSRGILTSDLDRRVRDCRGSRLGGRKTLARLSAVRYGSR